MPEMLLDRSEIVPRFQKMGRKRVPEGMQVTRRFF
jgi:hypothetical protein